MKPRDEITLGQLWPLLPDGDYVGVIERYDAARSSFQPKKRRDGQPRWEWRLFLHIKLIDGTDHRTKSVLARWLGEYPGLDPRVFLSLRYTTLAGQTTPEPPWMASKLYKALVLLKKKCRLTGERIPFEAFMDCGVKVQVRTVHKDADGDPLPRECRYSVGRKILDLLPRGGVPTSNLEPATKHQEPSTTHQLLRLEEEGNQVITVETFEEVNELLAARSNGVESPDRARGLTDQPLGRGIAPDPQGPTPSTAGLRISEHPHGSQLDQERARRLKRLFGKGADLARRGPCPRCGEGMYARSGETSRCLWCRG